MQYQFLAVDHLGEVAYYVFEKSKKVAIEASLKNEGKNLQKLIQDKILIAIEDLIEIRVELEFDNTHNIIL
jgi:hypothetical protein